MAVITLPADSSTLTLNGEILKSFAEGDNYTLEPVNPATARVNAVRGGVSIQGRSDAQVYNLRLRIEKYSDDHIQLNQWLNSSTPTVINGTSKTLMVRDGSDFVSSWNLENGSLTDQPTDVVNTQDGNSLMEYTIEFRSASNTL